MYFPGPRLNAFSTDPNSIINNLGSSIINRSSVTQKINKSNNFSLSNSSQLMMTKNLINNSKRELMTSSQLQSSKISQFSKVNNSPDKIKEKINDLFQNYDALMTKDRDNLQKIIKDYLVKKEDNLKN